MNIGDKVKIKPDSSWAPTVRGWLLGKVGTVIALGEDDYYGRLTVKFRDTPRQRGLFAIDADDLEQA